MNRKKDRIIRSIFKQLREEEEQFTPSFNQMLNQGKVTGSESKPWHGIWLRPVTVTVLLILVSVPILYNSLQDPKISDLEITADFEEWKAPTDFLLSFNDQPYTDGLPRIGSTFWELEENQEIEN